MWFGRTLGVVALVQQANAVESLSNVDVLCLDKTGTLTTNRIQFRTVFPLAIDEAELRRLLGEFAASCSVGNRTSEAPVAALGGQPRRVLEEVPFSSARKWSALLVDDPSSLRGTYVLGAPEMLAPSTRPSDELTAQANEWMASGLRVLLFAYRPDAATLHDSRGEPRLPDGLHPLGLVSLSDELRPEARQTLAGFAEAGIRLKIISGDSPSTVLALARQAGLAPDSRAISGLELADLDEPRLGEVASEITVFGRVTPSQKEQLVLALRGRGHYVAMIGDGVNDVLSLKRANLGIAMHSGSQAARAVVSVLCGLLLVVFVEPPTPWWTGGDVLSGDGRPALLAMLLSAVFVMILTMAPLRDFFELSLLGLADWVVLAGVTGIWVLAVHRAWRARVLGRLVA
jgi:cation-transporting ATPase E